ncbi:MAG: hypothetical protein IAE89_15645 [Anaerolineae bacterium]|nr:hypothetical protein [Anaerolineae bacterium]
MPSSSGAVLYQIEGGTIFDVIGPPECGDGYRWWQISFQGQAGWTAEGDNIEYFLELVSVFPPLAQDSAGPIVIADAFIRLPEANIYQLNDGRLTLLDDTLHVLDAALSPDVRFLAANVMASVVFESEGCSGPIPADLWLLNPETGENLMIRGQPENATYCGDDNNISRSEVDWSPDGRQFVWTEYNSGDDTLSLGVYDVAANQASVVSLDFPEQYGVGPRPITPYWLASGIAFYSVTYDEVAADSAVSVRLYMPDGTFTTETPIWIANDYGLPDTVLLITHEGRDYAAHHWFLNDYWTLYDLLNQQAFWFGETPAYPELVSAAQPETSLRVRLLPRHSFTPHSENPYQVEILDSSGQVLHDPLDIQSAEAIPQDMVLSPDGQTLAFQHYNTDTRRYVINFIGPDTASTFIPGEDISYFAFSWGSWQWIFPDSLNLAEFPDTLG